MASEKQSTTPKPASKISPNFMEREAQKWQCWAVANPTNLMSKLFLPPIARFEGVLGLADSGFLDRKRSRFGDTFCAAGMVVLGEFEEVKQNLTSPQKREYMLGTGYLDGRHLSRDGKNLFLLGLSDDEGENSDHDAFRRCLCKYVTNEKSLERADDATAKRLVQELVADYAKMDHGPGGDFFSSTTRGLKWFLVRYNHYILLGLDPDDKAIVETLMDLHFTRNHAFYYVSGVNTLYQTCGPGRKWPQLTKQVADIYRTSPALADFKVDEQFNHLSREDFAFSLTIMFGIAALLGPHHLASTCLGNGLPKYEGRETDTIDVTKDWDKLDLNDRSAIEAYILECGRLYPPVVASHRVATEPFTATIQGDDYTFPEGTLILIPIIMATLDEQFWGETTFDFNPQRKNGCPYSMIFHSVGERSAGRICPGKSQTLKEIADLLIACGKFRREAAATE